MNARGKSQFCLALICIQFVTSCKTGAVSNYTELDSKKMNHQVVIPDLNLSPSFQKYLEIVKAESPKESLSASEISSVYQTTIEHPVAKLETLQKYDPDGIIGFCFGRAMTAHLVARKSGLKKESLAKIFILGDLRSEGHAGDFPEWYFHVTTIAKGPNNAWYAIDPIMHTEGTPFHPLTASQWMNTVTEGWDATHGRPAKAKFYFVDSDAILPDIRNLPEFASETGDMLIETKFEPLKHGIGLAKEWSKVLKLDSSYAKRSFLISEELMKKHFLHTRTETSTTFDFEKVNVGTTVISYNNYFVDLMNSSLDPKILLTAKDSENIAVRGLSINIETMTTPQPEYWKGGFKLKK